MKVVPKKQLGQHFLVDENILGVIERLAELQPADVVLEIGPGLGVLTGYLADRVAHVHAVEIDRALEPYLRDIPRTTIHWGDALALDLAALEPPAGKLVANLPYNVATPLVVESLDRFPGSSMWCVMVQREVADRFFASPRTKAYGAVSVLVQLAAERTGLPPGLARGVPPAAERRVRAGRVPPHRAGHRPGRQAARRGVVRAPAQDARELARPLGHREPRSCRGRARRDRSRNRRPRRGARAARVRRPRSRARMISAEAPAKINLALVVGGTRPDGLHEVATILQRIDLCDTVSLEPAAELSVDGFADDTIVRRALEAVAAAGGVEPNWRARIEKRIPVAAGLGGGSTDAATAIKLACELLDVPAGALRARGARRRPRRRRPVLPRVGARSSAPATGTTLEPLDLPQDYAVLLVMPHGDSKRSTAEIYIRFDRDEGFDARRALVLEVARAGRAADLAALPPNDLARSPSGRPAALPRGVPGRRQRGRPGRVRPLPAIGPPPKCAAGEVAALGETWLTAPAW